MTFEELYKTVIKNQFHNEPQPTRTDKSPDAAPSDIPDYNPYHLDCLLHPEKYAPVIVAEDCSINRDAGRTSAQEGAASDCGHACQESCIFDAIITGPDGKLIIDPDYCTGCGACIDACKAKKLTANRDILPAMKAVREPGRLSYALIAPAFLGQFSEDVTPGRLRSAFKALGFTGMVEVALFADILTLKEALEFDQNITHNGDFQLTSCCCPVWIAMLSKVYQELMPHVPGSVSPMIACGRVIKKLHPDAVTVFIGPCIAKKSEARQPDIADAVDYVLTFQEVQDIFDAAGIQPETLPESDKDHSSRAGRIYAHTGGVSEAVRRTVEQLDPDREIAIKTRQADGVPACRAMIEELRSGELTGNFFEGMGCVGGCVGGPKAILDKDEGKKNVAAYGNAATYKTPLENPYVIELLHRLGFDKIEDLLEDSDIFTRHFGA